MLIRTQAKDALINLDKVTAILVYKNTNIVVIDSFDSKVNDVLGIGTYSTEEKTLKVLNKIQEYCIHDHPLFIMPQEEEI